MEAPDIQEQWNELDVLLTQVSVDDFYCGRHFFDEEMWTVVDTFKEYKNLLQYGALWDNGKRFWDLLFLHIIGTDIFDKGLDNKQLSNIIINRIKNYQSGIIKNLRTLLQSNQNMYKVSADAQQIGQMFRSKATMGRMTLNEVFKKMFDDDFQKKIYKDKLSIYKQDSETYKDDTMTGQINLLYDFKINFSSIMKSLGFEKPINEENFDECWKEFEPYLQRTFETLKNNNINIEDALKLFFNDKEKNVWDFKRQLQIIAKIVKKTLKLMIQQ